MDIQKFLLSCGLTETEITVYVRALMRDVWSASALAHETGLKRPTVYHALETLEKKGLMYVVGGKTRSAYRAEPPERIGALLGREKSRVESLEKKLAKALPYFPIADGSLTVSPEVVYYRGTEGLKNLIEKVYESKSKTLYSIMPSFRVLEKYIDEEYMYHYLSSRAKKGIDTKSIWQDMPSNKEFADNETYLRSVRIAPVSMHTMSNAMIDVFDQFVVVTVPHPELFGVMIKSFQYSESMKAIWQTLWDISTPLQNPD